MEKQLWEPLSGKSPARFGNLLEVLLTIRRSVEESVDLRVMVRENGVASVSGASPMMRNTTKGFIETFEKPSSECFADQKNPTEQREHPTSAKTTGQDSRLKD